MKRRGIRAFLVIVISLSIPVFQNYFHYYDLSEANFVSPDLSFESPDQEILPIMKQNGLKMLFSNLSPIIHLLVIINEQAN